MTRHEDSSASAATRAALVALVLMQLPVVVNMLQLRFSLIPGTIALLIAIVALSSSRLWARRSPLDLIVVAYVLWSLTIGGLLYLWPGNRALYAAYPLGVNLAVIPVAFYAVGRQIPRSAHQQVSAAIVNLHLAIVLASIALLFGRPDFYTEHVAIALADRGATEEWQFYARMQGYLGSTALGTLCSTSLLLLTATPFRAGRKFLYAAIFLAGAFLTFQRSSMVIAVAALLLLLSTKRTPWRARLLACAGGAAVAALLVMIENDETMRLLERLGEVAELLTLEDRDSYRLIADQLTGYPLGMGLGATTSAADSAGYNPGGQIVDANHLRILADLGPIGLALFLLIFAYGLYMARRARIMLPLGLVVLVYNMQAIGTNVFDSFYTGHLYWMYLGLIGAARTRPAVASNVPRRAPSIPLGDTSAASAAVRPS